MYVYNATANSGLEMAGNSVPPGGDHPGSFDSLVVDDSVGFCTDPVKWFCRQVAIWIPPKALRQTDVTSAFMTTNGAWSENMIIQKV